MTFQKDSRVKSNKMTYNKKKDKYVTCKDQVYYSLTNKQVFELRDLCEEIIKKEKLNG